MLTAADLTIALLVKTATEQNFPGWEVQPCRNMRALRVRYPRPSSPTGYGLAGAIRVDESSCRVAVGSGRTRPALEAVVAAVNAAYATAARDLAAGSSLAVELVDLRGTGVL